MRLAGPLPSFHVYDEYILTYLESSSYAYTDTPATVCWQVSGYLQLALAWIASLFDERTMVIVTSRPAVLEDVQHQIRAMGFEGRQITNMTAAQTEDLAEKMLKRLRATKERAAKFFAVLKRPECKSMSTSPMLLNLLIQVTLASQDQERELTRARLYSLAIELSLNRDANTMRLGAGLHSHLSSEKIHEAAQRIAFSNHLAKERGQPWEAYETMVEPQLLEEVRQSVASSRMPVLEAISGGSVRFQHLSYQEALVAKVVVDLFVNGEDRPTIRQWLIQCAGDPWWSQVLIMAAELLGENADGPFYDMLAADPRGLLRTGARAELSYGHSNTLKTGTFRKVIVTQISDKEAAVRVVGRGRKSFEVPRCAVYIPAAGVGVLAQAAAKAGAARLASELVRRGVHLGIVDRDYNSLLHIAISECHEDCALALMGLGAIEHALMMNVRGEIPRSLGYNSGLSLVVRKLTGGTPGDVDEAQGKLASLPVLTAARAGNLDDLKCLLSRENVNARTSGEGCTAMSLAAENGHADVLEELIRAGGNVNSASGVSVHEKSKSCLALAALGCHLGAVRVLLDANADPNAVDDCGFSVLEVACRFGREDIVDLLIERGASVNACTTKACAVPEGWSVLMGAVLQCHPRVCRRLLEAGANVHARTKGIAPYMAIHIAATYANE